jgi:hypothetical protein
MLCALGAIVFSASVARMSERAALALGFAAAAMATSGSRLPDAVLVGGLTAGGVAAYLFRPRWRFASFAIGGALAGWWTSLLEVQGLPMEAALFLAAATVIGTLYLSRSHPGFATDEVKDEGLLAIGLLGLGVSVTPGILDGWNAATNLSGASERTAEPVALPVWTLALILTASSFGAIYSLWSRR